MATTTDVDLAEIDIMDMKWFADGAPHDLFARMRAEAPVRWNTLPSGAGFWSVTRHADVSAISRDTETFSSYEGGIFLDPDHIFPLDVTRNLLLYMDPPQHTKYRKILQTAFVPATVNALEDGVRARVTKTIDAFIERGEADFAQDVAIPIPLAVLTELMGVPEEDIPKFAEWTEQIEVASRSVKGDAIPTLMEMSGYLHQQIERQIAEGTTDSLVMRLRNAEVEGEKLTDPEILVFFGLLAFAGNDTTRNTTATGFLELLRHPEALAALKADPSIIPVAVEEILRYTTVVQWFARTVTKDVELGGQQLKAGDKVVMWYTSASRDEDVFEDPQTFDIQRVKPDHKAFGGGGRHFCLGAGLARLEIRVILEEVIRRLDDVELAGDFKRVPNNWANGLEHLPIRFKPGAREAA
ncbi:MAG: cytochrome P450 [Solirubrobacteraceae bacterium]|nr:cytochrome P450 [Solirubrobacteraceae bacterium]